MISWQTIQSLLILFGPWLVPRILAAYRSIRSRPASQLKPLPTSISYALGLLFISGLIAFISTLPLFSQENVFRLTQSRLQTPAGVIMTRLAAIRALTPRDEQLRSVLDAGGLDARLLYARYGPAVLRDCPFTVPGQLDSGSKYLLYAAPTILAPHVYHLFALAVATSGTLSGLDGARWRTVAVITGVILAVTEFYFLATYDNTPNQGSTRLGEVDFAHWKAQVWRGLAIAAVDGVLGWVLWLQATGRAFVAPQATVERIAAHAVVMEGVLGKVKGLGVLRNGASRSVEMRRKADEYWTKDAEVMRDVFEQPEVLQAQRNVLAKTDVARVGREADQFLDALMAATGQQ